jgi:hypothetical protein
MVWALFLGVLKLILTGMVVFYALLVMKTLRTGGTLDQLRFNSHNPARSSERFLVWLGVRMAAATLAVLKACLNILEDASADVGEWVLHRHIS